MFTTWMRATWAVSALGAALGCGPTIDLAGTGGAGASSAATGTTTVASTGNAGTTSSATSTSAATTSATTGVCGGPPGVGNHSTATAIPLAMGCAPTKGTLVDAFTPDYFSFSGKKGQHVLIEARAQGIVPGSTNLFDLTVTDTVVVLYGPDGSTVLAGNDDAFPTLSRDSRLFTRLPVDGTYYYLVEDCNQFMATGCAPATDIITFDYETSVIDLAATSGETLGVLAGGAAPAIPYVASPMGPAGVWARAVLGGDFAGVADTQVFSFTPPATTASSAGARLRAYFWLQPVGPNNGDGSSSSVKLTVKDAGGNVLAAADQRNYQDGDNFVDGPLGLSFPLDADNGTALGAPCTLEITNEASVSAADTMFYFLEHVVGGPLVTFPGSLPGGQPEEETPGAHLNDTPATAEHLSVSAGQTAVYFIDGNVSEAGDVDWYQAAVPANNQQLWITCAAARAGSGLLGFHVEVFSDAGTTLILSLTESAPAKLDLQGPNSGTPLGTTSSVYVKVSAAGQDAVDTGTYYTCELVFQG